MVGHPSGIAKATIASQVGQPSRIAKATIPSQYTWTPYVPVTAAAAPTLTPAGVAADARPVARQPQPSSHRSIFL